MMIIGCDFHPRMQQIAFLDQDTGECGERRLSHPQEAAEFYRSLCGRPVRIGVEATGNFRWFQRLMSELGHEMLLGDPGAIHASIRRRQQTDKRDARHILTLLVEDRFPLVWQPGVENQDTRQLLLHRCRMVRFRARVKNQLDSMAKNEGLLSKRVWCPMRRKEIEALPLSGWDVERRKDLLALLDELDKRIEPLDEAVNKAAQQDAQARLLMTHPGVGPVVSLAYVLTIGDWQRFPRGKQVGSYLGLIPEEASSSNKRRLGHITKQGNTLLRWLLVEAASKAQRYDESWHRQYLRLSMNKHHGVAKVAIAHKLAVRLYSTPRTKTCPRGPRLDVALRARLRAGQGARFARGAVRLERNQSKRALAEIIKGGFFLRKKPLGQVAFGIHLLWFRCSPVAAA